MVNLFLASEPLRGWHQVRVCAQRTRLDFAHCIADAHTKLRRLYPAFNA